MTYRGAVKQVLFLALMTPLLSMAACSWWYTPQRAPDMLSTNPSATPGRTVVSGEADDYQQWLTGQPNLAHDLPWHDSRLKTSSGAPVMSSASTNASGNGVPSGDGWTTVWTTATPSQTSSPSSGTGAVHVQQQYPPY